VATRTHGVVERGPKVMVRATVGITATRQPALALVKPRGRRAVGVAVVACTMVGVAMMGAAALQTRLAQRQVQIDQLDREIRDTRAEYESLRRERAELRSPARLAEIAAANGMSFAADTKFTSISPEVLAIVAQSTGAIDADGLGDEAATLDDFRAVKAATEEGP
jgi:cell division protein FtsL